MADLRESIAAYQQPVSDYYLAYLRREAIKHDRKENDERWHVCFIAEQVVGKYHKGATKDLAQDLRRDSSTVENYARAGRAYLELLSYCRDWDLMEDLRQRLTYSHFEMAGSLMRRYEVPIWDILDDLKTAADEGASVGKTRDAMDGKYGDRPPAWHKHVSQLEKAAEELQKDFGVPPVLLWLAHVVVRRVRRVMDDEELRQ